MANENFPSSAKPPFFMVGCVRSGTTMLRNVLRCHPNLACPEETHFLRWGDPFGTEGLGRHIIDNPVLRQHREIDGISEVEFGEIFWGSESRVDLYQRYMALYVSRNKPAATRWFDKTPQNIYGAFLAADAIPGARFVHIVRNPINVVASLRIGKVIKVGWHLGGINYWNESIHIMAGLKRAYPRRVHEVKYEDFMRDPNAELRRLLEFIEEPYRAEWFEDLIFRASDHRDAAILTDGEVADVRRLCQRGMRRYAYGSD